MQFNRYLTCFAVASSLCAIAQAQWTSNTAVNTPVCVQPGDQAVPRAAATGDGKTWIGWFDHRGGNYDVYVQLLDRNGNPQLTTDGLLVSSNAQNSSLVDWDVIADSSGNCVLAFTDVRAGGDLDVYAYMITQSGTFPWGANGVTLSNNVDFEANPAIAELSDGSFVFVWPRSPNGTGTGAIRAQILDVNGNPLLGGGADIALATGTATNEKPAFCDVVASDNGSFIVQWLRNTATFTSPRYIKTQKYDSSGNALWNAGAPTSVYDFNSVPIAYQPIVQSDGAGGAVFCWHRSTALYDAFVQKVNASGAEVFVHNGVQVSLEANRHKIDPALAYLPASGDMIVVFDTRDSAQGNRGVSIQRISSAGALLWGSNGIQLEAVDSINEGFERIAPFGDGALVTYFQYPTFGSLNSNIIARRIDGSGADVWGSTTTLCSNLVSKDKPRLLFDGTGIGRMCWDDERADSGDIYAQDINVDGAVGPITTCTASTYCITAVNTVGPGATIGWTGSTSLALNDFTLTAAGCPPSANGLFFYGTTQIAPVLFSSGYKCVANPVFRNAVIQADGLGSVSYPLDLFNPTNPSGLITAGSTWNFQLWYRDPAGIYGPTNTTDALTASFCN